MKFSVLVSLFLVFYIGSANATLWDTLTRDISNLLFNARYLVPGIVKFLEEYVKYSESIIADSNLKDGEEVDFIVIGSGSGGGVVSSRLSETQSTVALLEAGGRPNLLLDVPLLAVFLQILKVDWDHRSAPSDSYCGAYDKTQCRFTRGKTLGGCSSINAMIYTRGNKADYDSWAAQGNDGWSYDDLLPYFMKIENSSELESDPHYASDIRGRDGPIGISYPYLSPRGEAFVKAGVEWGMPERDYNGPEQISCSRMQANIKDGLRVNVYRGYIDKAKNRKNFKVSMNSLVTKILINPKTKKAEAVEYIKNGKFKTIKARKEVILAAGAFGTPQILMLSGIGPQEDLAKHNITMIQNAPGVGKNLMDHVTMGGMTYFINTKMGYFVPDSAVLPTEKYLSEFFYFRNGSVATSSGVEAMCFWNSKDPTLKTGPVDSEVAFVDASLWYDTALYFLIAGVSVKDYVENFLPKVYHSGVEAMPIVLQPKSRGEVRLASDDPRIKPLITPNYYAEREDVETMIKIIRHTMEMMNAGTTMKKLGAKITTVKHCEKKHKFNTDEYWECVIRYMTYTFWHFSGTAKMGQDEMSVVDSKLKVKGINELRICDASIFPMIPAGHTNAITMVVGEKCADMISQEYGLKSQGGSGSDKPKDEPPKTTDNNNPDIDVRSAKSTRSTRNSGNSSTVKDEI